MPSKINAFLTGNNQPWKLKLKPLFSNALVFQRRKLVMAETSHPRPHYWFKTLLLLIVVSAVSFFNFYLLGRFSFAWLTFVFAAIVPVTVMVFLYEIVNKEKPNLIHLLLICVLGLTLSFTLTGLLSLPFNWVSDFASLVFVAPFMEEIAKFVSVLLLLKLFKVKSLSQALLFSWAIGSGFSVAETMGYSTFYGISGIYSEITFYPNTNTFTPNGVIDISTMFTRLYLSFGGHALWAMFYGAALFFSRQGLRRKFSVSYLFIWFGLALFLHVGNNLIASMQTDLLSYIGLPILQLLSYFLFFYLIDAVIRYEYNVNIDEDNQNVNNVEQDPLSEDALKIQ